MCPRAAVVPAGTPTGGDYSRPWTNLDDPATSCVQAPLRSLGGHVVQILACPEIRCMDPGKQCEVNDKASTVGDYLLKRLPEVGVVSVSSAAIGGEARAVIGDNTAGY